MLLKAKQRGEALGFLGTVARLDPTNWQARGSRDPCSTVHAALSRYSPEAGSCSTIWRSAHAAPSRALLTQRPPSRIPPPSRPAPSWPHAVPIPPRISTLNPTPRSHPNPTPTSRQSRFNPAPVSLYLTPYTYTCQAHYSLAHSHLMAAFARPSAGAHPTPNGRTGTTQDAVRGVGSHSMGSRGVGSQVAESHGAGSGANESHLRSALVALRRLHRKPISLEMRYKEGANDEPRPARTHRTRAHTHTPHPHPHPAPHPHNFVPPLLTPPPPYVPHLAAPLHPLHRSSPLLTPPHPASPHSCPSQHLGAIPPWQRANGRGIIGDEPPSLPISDIIARQSARRILSNAVPRQRGVILYKLGALMIPGIHCGSGAGIPRPLRHSRAGVDAGPRGRRSGWIPDSLWHPSRSLLTHATDLRIPRSHPYDSDPAIPLAARLIPGPPPLP